jgi:hypothetical protein
MCTSVFFTFCASKARSRPEGISSYRPGSRNSNRPFHHPAYFPLPTTCGLHKSTGAQIDSRVNPVPHSELNNKRSGGVKQAGRSCELHYGSSGGWYGEGGWPTQAPAGIDQRQSKGRRWSQPEGRKDGESLELIQSNSCVSPDLLHKIGFGPT